MQWCHRSCHLSTCRRLDVFISGIDHCSSAGGAGEARTEAMVQAANKTGDADAFDSFAEPAGLILTTVMKMLPAQYAAIPDLLRQAQALKLPGNPLVSLIAVKSFCKPGPIHI